MHRLNGIQFITIMKLFLTTIFCLTFTFLKSQTLTPLGDVNTEASRILIDKPYNFKNRFYFIGNGNSVSGWGSLAYTDGTSQGTAELTINGKSAPFNKLVIPFNLINQNNLVAANTSKFLFFVAKDGDSGSQTFLWCTDGTTNGLVQLLGLHESFRELSNAVILNDRVYFIAREPSPFTNVPSLTHLYVSDGTKTGTQIIRRNVSSIALYDNKILFFGSQNVNANSNITDGFYESDGSLTGTKLVQSLNLATDTRGFFDFTNNNLIVFSLSSFSTKNSELWAFSKKYGLQRLKSYKLDLESDVGLTSYSGFTLLNDILLFSELNLKQEVGSSTLKNINNVLRTDGSASGTSVVLSNLPSSINLVNSFVKNNRLYYFAPASRTRSSTALWATDGTERGTSIIKADITSGGIPANQLRLPDPEFYTIGQHIYFFGDRSSFRPACGSTGAQSVNRYFLYKTDGTTNGTVIISDSLNQRTNVVALNDKELYYSDWTYIYQSDGTKSGTKQLIRLDRGGGGGDFEQGFDFSAFTKGLLTLNNKVIINVKLNPSHGYHLLNPNETPTRCNTNIRLEAERCNTTQDSWKLCGDETSKFRLIPVSLVIPSSSKLQWQRNGVDIGGATASFYDVNQSGDYSVKIQANGCSATSMVQKIEVNKPRAKLEFSSGTLVGSWTGGYTKLPSEPRYSGEFYLRYDGKKVSEGSYLNNSVRYTPKSNERGLFTLVVLDANRCIDSTSYNVGGLNVTLRSSSTSVCSGTPIIINASVTDGTAPFTYQWRRGTTAITNNSASLTINQAGVYSLTVTDATNNRVTSSITINEGRFSASIAGAINICSGSSTTLTAVPTCGVPPYSYQWQRDGGAVGNAGTLIATVAGAYQVTITDSQGAVSTSVGVNVSQRVTPDATVAVRGATSLVPGSSVVLTVPAATGQTYQWQRDGQPIAGATASSFTATQAGSYTVTVSRDGCSATSTATVVSIILAAEPSLSGLVLDASPNPASRWLRVRLSLDAPATATFRLFDGTGRAVGIQVFGTAQRAHEHTFGMDNLPGGMLYLRAESGEKQLTKKIVKE